MISDRYQPVQEPTQDISQDAYKPLKPDHSFCIFIQAKIPPRRESRARYIKDIRIDTCPKERYLQIFFLGQHAFHSPSLTRFFTASQCPAQCTICAAVYRTYHGSDHQPGGRSLDPEAIVRAQVAGLQPVLKFQCLLQKLKSSLLSRVHKLRLPRFQMRVAYMSIFLKLETLGNKKTLLKSSWVAALFWKRIAFCSCSCFHFARSIDERQTST